MRGLKTSVREGRHGTGYEHLVSSIAWVPVRHHVRGSVCGGCAGARHPAIQAVCDWPGRLAGAVLADATVPERDRVREGDSIRRLHGTTGRGSRHHDRGIHRHWNRDDPRRAGTTYVGRVSQPDSSGGAKFVEAHQVTGGTGEFAGATGQLLIAGRADAAGGLTIDGLGVLIR